MKKEVLTQAEKAQLLDTIAEARQEIQEIVDDFEKSMEEVRVDHRRRMKTLNTVSAVVIIAAILAMLGMWLGAR